MKVNKYKIINLDYYTEDKLYQLEVESKGCLLNVEILLDNKIYVLSFYNIERFQQDINEELENKSYYNIASEENNIIFLEKLTLKNIMNSIQDIFKVTEKVAKFTTKDKNGNIKANVHSDVCD